ncbi:MAG TPA: nuclear transport factor 2 family protein [Chitinophagaceae bacterium]|nr:nuclear transport factor 2 family protein [Chitinophagaceae bacterium]
MQHRNYLYLFLMLLFGACREKPAQNLNEDNTQRVKHYFELFNSHQWEQLSNLYTDTASMKDPSLGLECIRQTKLDIKTKYQELQKAIPDVRDSIIAIYPSSQNTCTVEFISSGTLPDGSQMKLPICTIFTFKDSLIVADYTYYDNQ